MRIGDGLVETEVRSQYSAIAIRCGEGLPITVLHIGKDQCAVAVGASPEPSAVLTLAIGFNKIAREHFKHVPPTPLELENAIVTVEDEVAHVRIMPTKGSALFTTDGAIREIARIAGVSNSVKMTFTLDAVERTFERLSAVTQRKSPASDGLPKRPEFASVLLILREFMHHIQFSSIAVID